MTGVSGLTLTYPDGRTALKNLDWQIPAGAWLGIAGANGSGKTSLLYCLAGLIPKHIPAKISGSVTVDRPAGLMFQNPDFSLFNLTVREEAAFGATGNVDRALKTVGLLERQDADPQTLSYGEKQKLCLAALLARRPQTLLLDEPASMLDYPGALSLYRILERLNRQGKTIICVEHDTAFLFRFSRTVLLLDRGRQAAFGPSQTLLQQKTLIKRLGLKPL